MNRIKEKLRSKKITQKELAEKLGIAIRALSYYIRGERKTPLMVAKQIEVITERAVTIDDLIDHWNQTQRMKRNDESNR
jgi:transcriptional regulator with XRE-family HTH domain